VSIGIIFEDCLVLSGLFLIIISIEAEGDIFSHAWLLNMLRANSFFGLLHECHAIPIRMFIPIQEIKSRYFFVANNLA
jgi:hypothetical protein